MISTLVVLPIHWIRLTGTAALVLDLAHSNLMDWLANRLVLLIPTLILGALFLAGMLPVGECVLRQIRIVPNVIGRIHHDQFYAARWAD